MMACAAVIQRQPDGERSAAAFVAFARDTAAVQLDATFDNEKPQARSGHVFDVSSAVKGGEQPRLILRRNADAFVADLADRGRLHW